MEAKLLHLPNGNCNCTFVTGQAQPSLGADFLRKNLLLVDVLHNRLPVLSCLPLHLICILPEERQNKKSSV